MCSLDSDRWQACQTDQVNRFEGRKMQDSLQNTLQFPLTEPLFVDLYALLHTPFETGYKS